MPAWIFPVGGLRSPSTPNFVGQYSHIIAFGSFSRCTFRVHTSAHRYLVCFVHQAGLGPFRPMNLDRRAVEREQTRQPNQKNCVVLCVPVLPVSGAGTAAAAVLVVVIVLGDRQYGPVTSSSAYISGVSLGPSSFWF
jgi:hypothetical protein